MGLLVLGTPLKWEDSLDWLEYVRINGVLQFLSIYNKVKDISGDTLKWGDELEYGILKIDPDNRTVKISLRGAEILKELNQKEELYGRGETRSQGCNWLPEYGSWMIEATPRVPYGGFTTDLRYVEVNMRLRRHRLITALGPQEIAPTLTCFPLMGVNNFTDPPSRPNGPIAKSLYLSDEVINPHPRFGTLTANIRKRRGRKVDIRVPLFKDKYTEIRLQEKIQKPSCWSAESSRPCAPNEQKATIIDSDSESKLTFTSSPYSPSNTISLKDPYPGFIHMDSMGFGMGMCCLQITFQARDVHESRHLYDHLAVLSPIMLALTAATPILKGQLADTDVRWATISASVDDRTPEESGSQNQLSKEKLSELGYDKMAGNGVRRLPKSRYEGISLYICNHLSGADPEKSLNIYNDVIAPYDEKSYEMLRSNGIDDSLAKHVAHLFIRDPLVIYSERTTLNNETETDHFENIQSTNWQTVRWKPPPMKSDEHVGWRTEFRSMEVQITDFENAAFTVFIVLVSRVILAFDLNLYIPLSKVEANMEIAHRRDAVRSCKFFFRCHLAPPVSGDCPASECDIHSDPNAFESMSIKEIMLGKGSYFPGLIPLIFSYLDHIGCDKLTRETVTKYMKLIERRATGDLPTAATWIRNFVKSHPDYAHDSVIPEGVAYDLVNLCKDIGEGNTPCPELLGDVTITPFTKDEAYDVPLKSTVVQESKRNEILARYCRRSSIGDKTEVI